MDIDGIRFLDWLSGFVDGEGSFTVIRKNRRRSSGFVCDFRLCVRDDDCMVIEEIKRHTGIGKVEYSKSYGKRHERHGHPQVSWRVYTKADCRALIRILDRNPLRTKKARDYGIWRTAVLHWVAMPSWGTKLRNWAAVAALKAELENGRRYRSSLEITRRANSTQELLAL